MNLRNLSRDKVKVVERFIFHWNRMKDAKTYEKKELRNDIANEVCDIMSTLLKPKRVRSK